MTEREIWLEMAAAWQMVASFFPALCACTSFWGVNISRQMVAGLIKSGQKNSSDLDKIKTPDADYVSQPMKGKFHRK